MIIMKNLKERSFTPEDIPEQFFVVTDVEYNLDLKDIKKGVLNVSGISGSAKIILNFLGVARDLVITMDGEELVKKNNLTRIMYDNPHYLVSNNMIFLSRLFQNTKIDYYQIFHNLFDYCKIFMKKSSNPVYNDLYYKWDFGNPPYYDFDKAYKKSTINIQNMNDFVKTFLRISKKIDDYNGKEEIESMPYDDLYKMFWEALLITGHIYKDESEWVLKDKNLILPDRMKFIMGMENIDVYYQWKNGELTPQQEFFMSDSTFDRWKKIDDLSEIIMNNGYPWMLIDMKEFKELRSAISNASEQDKIDALLRKYPELDIDY